MVIMMIMPGMKRRFKNISLISSHILFEAIVNISTIQGNYQNQLLCQAIAMPSVLLL